MFQKPWEKNKKLDQQGNGVSQKLTSFYLARILQIAPRPLLVLNKKET